MQMKKVVLTLIIMVAGWFSAQAQVWIGGSVDARLNKESQSFSIAPDVGYCFSNVPFSIACAMEYGGTFKRGEAYSQSLTLSPYFRYDICDLNEHSSLFVDLYSDFDMLEFSYFDIGLSPGISFEISEHWSTEFSFGLLEYDWERIPDDKPNQSIGLCLETVAPSFGIFYNF